MQAVVIKHVVGLTGCVLSEAMHCAQDVMRTCCLANLQPGSTAQVSRLLMGGVVWLVFCHRCVMRASVSAC